MVFMLYDAEAQRLSNKPDSGLKPDSSLIAMQDLDSEGVWRWSKLSYGALRDSIRDYDNDPTGALVMQKFLDNGTFAFVTDTVGTLVSKSIVSSLLSNSKKFPVVMRANAISQYKHNGINVYNWGGNAGLYYGSYQYNNAMNWRVFRSKGEEHEGDFFTPSDGFWEFQLQESYPTGYLYPFEMKVSPSRDSTHTLNHFGNYFHIKTTRNGESSSSATFEINEDGFWNGTSYSSGYAKFSNGTLEEMTALEVLNDLGASAPVYQDNAAASAALGTGKVYRDNTGYLRVSY